MLNLYALTLFLSALLLFGVQPMFTKMVLPLLGGSPTVWNTAMVFFQGMLLLGYAYAHLSTRWFGLKKQGLLRNKISSVLRNQLIRLYIMTDTLIFSSLHFIFKEKSIFRNHLMANKKG